MCFYFIIGDLYMAKNRLMEHITRGRVGPTASPDGDGLTDHRPRSTAASHAVLTPSVRILATAEGTSRVVGYIQEFQPTESRHMNRVYEMGNEDCVEIVPGAMNEGSISVKRVLLYHARLLEIFDANQGSQNNAIGGANPPGDKVFPVSLLDYNNPFTVQVVLKTVYFANGMDESKEGNFQKIVMEEYRGCWFSQLSYEVKASTDFYIFESGTIQYTYKVGNPLYARSGDKNA